MGPKAMAIGRMHKRSSVVKSSLEKMASLVLKTAELLRITTPASVYHMDDPLQYNALSRQLWSGDYLHAIGRFTDSNPGLVSLFEQQLLDDADEPSRLHQLSRLMPRWESVLSVLWRARSQKLVPLEAAALSIRLLHYQTPHQVWRALKFFAGGAIMSRAWVESMCTYALLPENNPGAPYVVASGISGAVFDNFAMQVGFGTYSTMDSTGYRLDMTNWASVVLPAAAVPAGCDIPTMLNAGGLFRADAVLDTFIDLFSPIAPDIVQNQHSRWVDLLARTALGTLWDKEPFASPYPPTYFHYHSPFFDRGQSSYADINFCLDQMRASSFHEYSAAIMLGGDGLSYMRIIDRIAQDPQRFLCTTPVVIPRLGEAPHGKYHVMHAGWRLWEPLLMQMAVVTNNKHVVSDPSVSAFNQHEHFVRIVTRAFAEYVLEISLTGMDYKASPQFLKAADSNLSFSYICMFLFLFGFPYVQFRSAVRRNDSSMLDTLWREFLGTMRTDLSNKTNYSKMAVVLIYWGCSLVEPLQTMYHNTRTLRLQHTHVGWDMPIEVLNLWIRTAVVYNVTKEYLIKFIHRLNFTHVVTRALDAIIKLRWKDSAGRETLKDIDRDVEAIKKYLRCHIGVNFVQATTQSDANLLNLDMQHWGGDRSVAQKRNNTPWAQIRRAMLDYREYVQEKVVKACPWHRWR